MTENIYSLDSIIVNISDNKNIIPKLININDDLIPIRDYSEDKSCVKYQNDSFKISIDYLENLNENIINTRYEYVHPTVFTDFIKRYFNIRRRIIIPDNTLYKLRIWCNIYRNNIGVKSKLYSEYYLYILAKNILDVLYSNTD